MKPKSPYRPNPVAAIAAISSILSGVPVGGSTYSVPMRPVSEPRGLPRPDVVMGSPGREMAYGGAARVRVSRRPFWMRWQRRKKHWALVKARRANA